METYTLKIFGLERKLPIIHISQKTKLANFSILGDVELVDALSDEIAAQLMSVKFDYLVCPEAKVAPLVHGVAKRLGHKHFVVCRKSVKPYMIGPIILKPLPHFPKHVKTVVINGSDVELLAHKRVIILDDVISTGFTIKMLNKLMEKIGATVVQQVVVFRQGESLPQLPNLTYLCELPIFLSDPV